jgi:hypothetical protein
MPTEGVKPTERQGRRVAGGSPTWVYLDRCKGYPLFQRRNTKQNGETSELTLGPCLASVVKWVIFALLAFGLMKAGANASEVAGLIKLLHFF